MKTSMSALANTAVRMTVDEFLNWDSRDHLRYELVDGEPRAMAPASPVHGLLQARLIKSIGNHLDSRGTGCEVVTNPGVIPALMSAFNMRVPDIAVTRAPVLPGHSALPEPVLLIEILSPAIVPKPGPTSGPTPASPAFRRFSCCTASAWVRRFCGARRMGAGRDNSKS